MQGDAKQVGINEYAEKLIKRTAEGLVGNAGLTKSDVEDLEQELRLELLKRLRGYDPSRSTYTTFVWFVVEHHAKEILDFRCRKKRDPAREAFSLNEEVPDGEEGLVERGWIMTHDDDKRRDSRVEQERIDMAIDVNAVLARLPKETRRLCELVMATSVPEAARRLGMPEITARKRLEALREKFRRAGLDDYLRNSI